MVDKSGAKSFATGAKASGRNNKGKHWLMDAFNLVNESIPTFNELFDKDVFYKFVLVVLCCSALFVFLMVRVFKVRVREYPVGIEQREGRDWKPANPFRFPWDNAAAVAAPNSSGQHTKRE